MLFRSMKPLTLLCLAASAALSGSARADWEITLYTGDSYTFPSDLRVQQSITDSDAVFSHVSWAPHPFALGAAYYGLSISFFPRSGAPFGGFLDRTHYKMYAETSERVQARGTWERAPLDQYAPLGERVQNLQIAHGINLTSLGAEYRWNATFEDGPWETYVGAGPLVYLPHSEGAINSIPENGGYQYGGAGGQVLGGTELRLSQHVALMMAGKFDAGSVELDLDPAARISTEVRTLNLIGGVSFHF
jgi:hypothetical protein